jgi:hypothetical protein
MFTAIQDKYHLWGGRLQEFSPRSMDCWIAGLRGDEACCPPPWFLAFKGKTKGKTNGKQKASGVFDFDARRLRQTPE